MSSSKKPLQDLVSLITTARSCLSGDPRDRIYALLALLDERSGIDMAPDYTKTVKEVYTDVTVQFLKAYNNLDFLADIEMSGAFPDAIPCVSIERNMRQLQLIHEFTAELERTIKELEFDGWFLPSSLPGNPLRTIQSAADLLVEKAHNLTQGLMFRTISNGEIHNTFATEIQKFFSREIDIEYAHEARKKCHSWKRAHDTVGMCSRVLKKEIYTSFMQKCGTCLIPEYLFWPMPSKRQDTKVVRENLGLPCWVPDYRYHPLLSSFARSYWNGKPHSFTKKVVARFHACSQDDPTISLDVRAIFVDKIEFRDCDPGDKIRLCDTTLQFLWDSAFDNFSQYFGESLINTRHGATIDDIRKFAQGRRLAWTQKSLVIAPANFALGDVIAVLYGGTVPYLIRPSGSGPDRFHLIGECYLHGIKGPQFAPNYAELLGYFKDHVKLGPEGSELGDLKDFVLRDGKGNENAGESSHGPRKVHAVSTESKDHATPDMEQDGLPWNTIYLV